MKKNRRCLEVGKHKGPLVKANKVQMGQVQCHGEEKEEQETSIEFSISGARWCTPSNQCLGGVGRQISMSLRPVGST